jgi:hypothetical protein
VALTAASITHGIVNTVQSKIQYIVDTLTQNPR